MNKKTKKKIQISEAATERYLVNERFTIKSLADELKMDSSEIYDLFPNRRSILEFYYESVIIRYQTLTAAIEGYNNFTMAEKLSNLALTVLDMFQERREFVSKTYNSMIACSNRSTHFEKNFKNQLSYIYEQDKKQSTSASVFNGELTNRFIVLHFHGLINFWLRDSSEGYQKTMELVDKWTALVQEINYSSVIDRGFDLAKFAFYNSPLNSFFDFNNKKGAHT
ncbi:MAG: hypothetical protein WD381_05805 [Balneolaceae bacterium]